METDESGKPDIDIHLEFTYFLLSGVESLCERTSESESEAPKGYLDCLLSILLPDLPLTKGILLGVGDKPALLDEMEFLSSQLRNLAPRHLDIDINQSH